MKSLSVYLFLCCFAVLGICSAQSGTSNPVVFPPPLDMKATAGTFVVDDATHVFAPGNEGSAGAFAAYLLSSELADKYGQPTILSPKQTWANNEKAILIGTITNPVIRKYADAAGLATALKQLGEEGYILSVTADRVVIASNTDKGTLWGLSSLRQLIRSESGKTVIPQLVIKDSPAFPMRGIKLYLPGKDNIPFFKRFVKDFVALYKFNTIILELNANMRLNRHPELNTAAVEFARYLSDNRLDRPLGPHREYQNSSHQDNADGQILEKQEVADLVAFMRKFNIEVIPELPSLTHSYYLLAAHKELAENTHQEYPDTYCPLKPEIYKIYFDVLDEYIDVIHPSIVHIGHDEWRMEKDLCPLCRGKDYGQLFAGDLNKIHDHLKEKGIRTAMWGDHLLASVRGKDYRVWKTSTGYEYKIPAALTAEQVTKLIPKDILIFNWFWDEIANDRQVSSFGFQQVYGNFLPEITDWDDRRKIKGLQGGAPSSWAATTEFNFGKDQLYDFLGTANLLWSGKSIPDDQLAFTIEPLIGDIHVNLSGKPLPSATALQVQPLDISPAANASLPDLLRMPVTLATEVKAGDHQKLTLMSDGKNKNNCVVATGVSSEQTGNSFTVNRDVNSIIFLHACVNLARNDKAYRRIHDFDDTATLLGWYEITYEDGMIETVPIRYGVNILDWRWRQRIGSHEPAKNKYSQDKYAYQASAVDCAGAGMEPVTFFCYEWLNPRLGKVVREVKLKSVARSDKGDNAIMVLAVSVATSTPPTSSPASSGQGGSGSPASESEEPRE